MSKSLLVIQTPRISARCFVGGVTGSEGMIFNWATAGVKLPTSKNIIKEAKNKSGNMALSIRLVENIKSNFIVN